MYTKVTAIFNHPGYDIISGLTALWVIVAAGATIALDSYGQYRGHPPLKIDSNLAILGGLPIAHFFGRISRHFHPTETDLKNYTAPTLEMPDITIPVQGEDSRYSLV